MTNYEDIYLHMINNTWTEFRKPPRTKIGVNRDNDFCFEVVDTYDSNKEVTLDFNASFIISNGITLTKPAYVQANVKHGRFYLIEKKKKLRTKLRCLVAFIKYLYKL